MLEPGLAYALLARPTVVRTLCIIRHKEHALSPAAEALIRAIRDYLRGSAIAGRLQVTAGATRRRA